MRTRRALHLALGVTTGLAAWAVAAALLPSGLPAGVILLGVVLGGLSSLTAMGLVLVHRSSRIVNFAQAEIGGIAATSAVIAVTGWDLPYVVAIPVGLALAAATGVQIDALVVRRFATAPRLILTVATIGVAQILGSGQIVLPELVSGLDSFTRFTTPFEFTFRVGPLIFTGDHVVAMVAVIGVLAALTWFFRHSDTGIAVRAAADSNERALLLGIPVRRLSRTTWVMAASLSGLGAILAVPIVGPNIGTPAGPFALLPPLTAAVIGRMKSLPVTVGAAIGIGVFQQVIFWNYPRSSTVEVGLFVLVLGALLIQRRRRDRGNDADLGGYVAVREVRPIPAVLARLPEVRAAKAVGWILLTAIAGGVPLALTDSRLVLMAYVCIYGIIAVSLVVLTGWAGQVSLGQFAFVGVGAATTASLLVHARADLFAALLVAALAGGAAAVLVGIPALRIPGLFLAVTTLAFAVPVSTFLLNAHYFPLLNPEHLIRPVVLGRFELERPIVFYYFCLAFLVVVILLARNFRRSRIGRVVIAIRDNERAGAAFSVAGVRTKLVAFAFSGAIAGVAGGLFAVGLRGIPFSGFAPISSLVVFSMVVIGGVASLPGALLGAAYVRGAQYFLTGYAQLLATGAGLLFLLMVAPGGLGEIAFGLRDRALRAVARRRGLSVPSLAERPPFASEDSAESDEAVFQDRVSPNGDPSASLAFASGREGDAPAIISCSGIDAGYGSVQVLFDVNAAVASRDVLALLGTNGAGKSTLLRVIAGVLPAQSGRIFFDGKDITSLGAGERVKAGLVTVPGGRGVFGSLTVAENLRMAGWLSRGDPAFQERATARVFELFPILRQRLNTQASMLSGGEQQMLTLAQAMFCRPRLLLIDELSLGLAPAVVESLLEAVRTINQEGTAVVLVEQSINVATRLANSAVFMERGQVRFIGAIAHLADRPDLLRPVFLRVAERKSPASSAIATSEEEPPALEVSNVSRLFGGVTALNNVNLVARRGEILGVIGSNGAGKTTLFDVCSGFLAPDAGTVRLHDRDVTEQSAADRARLGLGRSFQDARLFPSMTVVEALATAMERHIEVRDPLASIFGVGAARVSELDVSRRVDELIDAMNLGRYRDAFVSELSTGTRRIVELACVIAHQPSVVLLDEPSSGIAQRETEVLGGVLLDVKDRLGATLVLIEHDIPLVSSIAHRLVCLHLGTAIAEGRPEDVLNDPGVVASYLGSNGATSARSGDPSRNGAGKPRIVRTPRAGRAGRADRSSKARGRRR